MSVNGVDDLRMSDLAALLSVVRLESLTGAARELGVTASQVSKTVKRLERRLGVELLKRTTHGVRASSEAARLLPQIEDLVSRTRALVSPSKPKAEALTLVSQSYLLSPFLIALSRTAPKLRVRGFALSTSALLASTSENIFEVAYLLGEPRLPDSWSVHPLVEMPCDLIGNPRLKASLGDEPLKPERVREIPFIRPLSYAGRQIVPVDDACPLSPAERVAGYEVHSLETALDLATSSDQLLFGPRFAAVEHYRRELLAPILVEGWNVTVPLSLCIHADHVTQEQKRVLLASAREVLRERGFSSPPAQA